MDTTQMYMNPHTGSVDTYAGWEYETEEGDLVNAVDRGEVIAVVWDSVEKNWIEA